MTYPIIDRFLRHDRVWRCSLPPPLKRSRILVTLIFCVAEILDP